MTQTYVEVSLREFSDRLSAKEPTPGGGAACSYAAVLGTALNEMVSNFTVGKRKYADAEPEILKLLERLYEIRMELIELTDRDAAAYGALSGAYGMPKDTLERKLAIEAGLKGAAEVPLSVMRLSEELMVISARLCEIGNPNLITDAGCGAELCCAAAKASMMNVAANTKHMTDRALAESMENEAKVIVLRCQELEAGIFKKLVNI